MAENKKVLFSVLFISIMVYFPEGRAMEPDRGMDKKASVIRKISDGFSSLRRSSKKKSYKITDLEVGISQQASVHLSLFRKVGDSGDDEILTAMDLTENSLFSYRDDQRSNAFLLISEDNDSDYEEISATAVDSTYMPMSGVKNGNREESIYEKMPFDDSGYMRFDPQKAKSLPNLVLSLIHLEIKHPQSCSDGDFKGLTVSGFEEKKEPSYASISSNDYVNMVCQQPGTTPGLIPDHLELIHDEELTKM